MGVGLVCWTLLSTGLSEWEVGPRHAERSPIAILVLLQWSEAKLTMSLRYAYTSYLLT